MKNIKKTTILIPIFMVLFTLILISSTNKVARKEGAEPGHTGSPGDGKKDCTACHGGSALIVDNWIVSDIPAEGYEPNKEYTITATNTEPEGTRFGFQVSPQALNGDLQGELILTDTVQTQLVGNKKYITYTANGVNGPGFKSWTFKWKAPAKNTGNVMFYGAFNSNFEGHKGNDQTFITKMEAPEKGNNTSVKILKIAHKLSIYPTPANSIVNINLLLKKKSNLTLNLLDYQGKIVKNIEKNKAIENYNSAVDVSQLATGIYILSFEIDGSTYNEKILIKQ